MLSNIINNENIRNAFKASLEKFKGAQHDADSRMTTFNVIRKGSVAFARVQIDNNNLILAMRIGAMLNEEQIVSDLFGTDHEWAANEARQMILNDEKNRLIKDIQKEVKSKLPKVRPPRKQKVVVD